MLKEINCSLNEQYLTIGSRIRHIRKSLKMTQKKFAESLGIVQGFLSVIEKDKKKPSDTLLIALQHLYKLNSQWISSGQGKITQDSSYYSNSPTENLTAIPLLDELMTYKEEFPQAARSTRYISLPDIPEDCFAFIYTGEYMSPTIRNGDIIVIKPGETFLSGNICLIVGKWEEPFLRRYREINGAQHFSSDNTSYAPFQQDASIKIMGVVVKIWREIKI